MKYQIGDKVRIKSLDWYNKNKDKYGSIYAGNGFCFWKNMARHCGEIMKITIVKVDPKDSNKGYYFMENSEDRWTDEMFEGLAEEENNDCEKCGLIRNSTRCLFMDNCPHNKQKNIIEIPEDCVLKDENGNVINATKIVLEKKKKEYPKTYEECINELDINEVVAACGWKKEIKALQTLLVCRDAYWKIAGEEMGLGKPWEPSGNEDCFVISRSCGEVFLFESAGDNEPFEFPTREMRDAFYENFKELIEQCKELL